jgi:uncharacterized RDD family membrane protein YckC
VTPDVPGIPQGDQLAALGRRALAAVLDGVVILIPMMMLIAPLALSGDELTNSELLIGTAASAALSGLYHALCIRIWGKTIGKSACGCVVVRASDGGPPDGWASCIRALVPLVAGAVPVVGPMLSVVVYGVAIRDPRRQGLHDKAAATIVVQR